MNRRRYDDYTIDQAAGEIAHEVVATGKSSGWCSWDPKLTDLRAIEAKLAPFNIVYVDDMYGTWALKSTNG